MYCFQKNTEKKKAGGTKKETTQKVNKGNREPGNKKKNNFIFERF